MLKNALLVTAGIVIGAGAVSVLQAQSNAPYYVVAEINVNDQPAMRLVALIRFATALCGTVPN